LSTEPHWGQAGKKGIFSAIVFLPPGFLEVHQVYREPDTVEQEFLHTPQHPKGCSNTGPQHSVKTKAQGSHNLFPP
jgi:hypothetical protein